MKRRAQKRIASLRRRLRRAYEIRCAGRHDRWAWEATMERAAHRLGAETKGGDRG